MTESQKAQDNQLEMLEKEADILLNNIKNKIKIMKKI